MEARLLSSISTEARMRARCRHSLNVRSVSAGKQPCDRPRRGAGGTGQVGEVAHAGRVRQHLLRDTAGARIGGHRHEGGRVLGLRQFEQSEACQQIGAVRVHVPGEQRQHQFAQQSADGDDELAAQTRLLGVGGEPGGGDIERPHLQIGQHVDRVLQARRHPDGAARWDQPAAFGSRDLHHAAGGEQQLRLGMHVQAEMHAPVVRPGQNGDATGSQGKTIHLACPR
jgi:hypothetical protein